MFPAGDARLASVDGRCRAGCVDDVAAIAGAPSRMGDGRFDRGFVFPDAYGEVDGVHRTGGLRTVPVVGDVSRCAENGYGFSLCGQ